MSGEYGVLELLGIRQETKIVGYTGSKKRAVCFKEYDEDDSEKDGEERGFSDSTPSLEEKGFIVEK